MNRALFKRLLIVGVVGIGLSLGLEPQNKVQALTLTSQEELVEVMLTAQSADASFLGGAFGPDVNSPLSFVTMTDSIAKTYSYTLLAGSTYQSQPLSLSGSGFFNAVSGEWETSSSGALGANSWTTTGVGDFINVPTVPISSFDFSTSLLVLPPIPFPILLDFHTTTTYSGIFDIFSTTTATTTVFGFPILTTTAKDFLNPFTGEYFYVQDVLDFIGKLFALRIDGVAPPDGAGAGTANWLLIPEPCSLALAVSSLLGIVCYRRR